MNDNVNNERNEQTNGLGALTNSGMAFESSTFETQDVNPNCLITDKNKFITLDSYYTYLRQWFNNTGVAVAQDTSDNVKAILNYPYMFDIGFPNENSETHAVIACSEIMAAKQFLANCKTGKFSTPALMFCFYSFNESDKRIALNNNIELVGINEMYDLNNAITSVFGGITIGNTVMSKLQKGLREKFKGNTLNTKNIQSEINSTGDNIMHVISDGFDQLKGSIACMLGAIGAGKAANAVTKFNNPFEPQCKHEETTVEQTNSFGTDASVYATQETQTMQTEQTEQTEQTMQTEQSVGSAVNLDKNEATETQEVSTENIFAKSEENVQGAVSGVTLNKSNRPSVSLTKTDVETTDNVVVHNDSTVSTAEDFLKIN